MATKKKRAPPFKGVGSRGGKPRKPGKGAWTKIEPADGPRLKPNSRTNPTLYCRIYAAQVGKLPPPITNSQLADFFGIGITVLHEWKAQNPEFAEAIRRAKDKVDDEVEHAFYRRAIGYEHPSEKIFPPRRGSTKPIRANYTERYPPDTPAAINWLKNRRPDVWREKPEDGDSEAPPPISVTIEFKDARHKPKED